LRLKKQKNSEAKTAFEIKKQKLKQKTAVETKKSNLDTVDSFYNAIEGIEKFSRYMERYFRNCLTIGTKN
jgi:tRNA (Thr-GGU) A37 N-methylase